MKKVALVLAWLMAIGTWFGAIGYFTEMWGPIGFFGALITLFLSTALYVIIVAFSSIGGFIGTAMWVLLMVLLFNYGSQD